MPQRGGPREGTVILLFECTAWGFWMMRHDWLLNTFADIFDFNKYLISTTGSNADDWEIQHATYADNFFTCPPETTVFEITNVTLDKGFSRTSLRLLLDGKAILGKLSDIFVTTESTLKNVDVFNMPNSCFGRVSCCRTNLCLVIIFTCFHFFD